MGQAIAADINLSNQGNETESKNVKFEVALDESDKTVKEKTANIASQDVKLAISVSVQGGGYLKDAAIELVDTNFKFKNDSTKTKVSLGTLQSEDGISVAIPVIAKNDESFNLRLLDMQSKIKLTGEYIDVNGSVKDINTTKAVKIAWTADELNEESISLNQKVITNKIYNIEGTNKRVVQVLVESKLKDNVAPIKSTLIEVENPNIGAEPQEVVVAGYTTKATNGKTSLEFADGESSSWEYKQEEGKTYINILNNPNQDNNVAWAKNAQDKFVVTYVYSEDASVSPFISDAKATIDVYGRTNGTIEKTNNLTEEIAEMGDIIKLETSLTNKIYKGKMYVGEDTDYQEESNVYVPYSKLANRVIVESLGDEVAEGVSTYYKTTKINRDEAIKLLGEEGTISIEEVNSGRKVDVENGTFTQVGETGPIHEINLSEEAEDGYYTISYNENVNKISIAMSNPKTEGTIKFVNEKAVKVSDKNAVADLKELKSNTILSAVVDKNDYSKLLTAISTSVAKLEEPKTTANVTLDKTSISTGNENTVKITAELVSKDANNKLFKNPTINIVLPKEITQAQIENVTPVVGSDELEVKTYNVTTNNDGNKVIVVEFAGEETKYSANSATIAIDVKLATNAFMADKNVEVKSTIINGEERVEKVNPLTIKSKDGLVTKTTLTAGENKVEAENKNTVTVNANANDEVAVSTSIMNNYGDTLSNVNMVGEVPEDATLKSEVTTGIEGATVKYLTEEGTETTNLNEVKSFKIESDKDLAQGETTQVNYRYALKSSANNQQEGSLKIEGTLTEDVQSDVIRYIANIQVGANGVQNVPEGTTTNSDKLQVNVVVTAGGQEIAQNGEVNNGQVLRYKVTVKNISSEDLNNVKLKSTIENGVFYDLVEDGGTYYDDKSGERLPGHRYSEVKDVNVKEIPIAKLEAGKTQEFDYQVVAYIGQGENANQFKNNMVITADNMNQVSINDTKTIKEGKIALRLHYSSNEEPILYSNGDEKTFEIDLTNLTQTDLKNINININLPDELICDIENPMNTDLNEINISNTENGITINVYDLAAGETKNVYFQLRTNSIPVDKLEKEVTLVATANYEGTTYLSNDYVKTIYQAETKLDTKFTSDKEGQILHEGDEITYTLRLVNNGVLSTGNLYIFNDIPDGLNVKSIVSSINSGENVEHTVNEEGYIEIEGLELKVGDSLTLTIVADLEYIPEDTDKITNTIEVSGSTVKGIEKSLVNNLEDADNPESGQDENKDGTNSISGLAWIDENKDGTRDSNEKILQGVKVVLLDKDGKQVAEQTTSLTGTYKFTNVEPGEYIVAFKYDSSKYAVAKYQSTSATEETNSDAISKEIEINGEKILAGVTDTIKLDGKNIENIDIGLVENAKFDLRLDKYIKKVVLTNSAGTSTYEYQDTNLAKVEISAKRIAGTVLLVEYELKVTNEGDVDSYVGDIQDYLPDGMVFTSESNKEWYMDGNKILHTKELSEQVIRAGETKSVTLVLTKTLKENSTGTIENIGEIGASSNKMSITDFDSVAGNKKAGEDDMSQASLIVSISTGSPLMYIGIVIGTMLVLGLGIYIINKKVLKEAI